ncbi:unnamed protein product, partial [Aphanomyces euteiches]
VRRTFLSLLKMILLCCATVGEVEFVNVEIDYGENVYSLTNKIKESLGYPGLTKDLELYLALENGQWLEPEAVQKGELAETINELTQRDKRLNSGVSVGKYFVGQDEQKKPVIASDQVHVLVVAPKYDRASSMPDLKRDMRQLQESVDEVMSLLKKQKSDGTSWSCSKLSTGKIKQLGYNTLYVPWPTVDYVSSERDYPEFKWNDGMSESNPTHVKRYKEYFDAVLDETSQLSIGTEINLGISVGKSHRMLKGKADLCIVPKESFTRNDIVMVIELKSGSREDTLSGANRAETMGYFLAANTLFSHGELRPPPIGLLTNLNDAWCYFWKNGDPLDRKTALYYMRKHCNYVDSCIQDENVVLRKDATRDPHVVFGAIPAGELEKYVTEYEDNMADVLETDEEIRFYQMSKRLRHTTAFDVPSDIPLFMYLYS